MAGIGPTPAPTSSRTFDSSRNQTVTSQREPVLADFKLPEINRIPYGPAKQAQAIEQPQQQLAAARYQEPEYIYEPTYVQPDNKGGYSAWVSGMGYGQQTTPTASGSRRVRNPNYRGPNSGGGVR